ncbi:transposable element Tc1 transposase [Trichonephila clavipes]|nr:transposable element Tc1 transposase [Trichonephila clavipes]
MAREMSNKNSLEKEGNTQTIALLSQRQKGKGDVRQVLDATSKLPAGVLQGTFADYGSFDECLKVETPQFKGQSCALEARPPRPPLSRDFTLVKAHLDGNNGTLSGFFKVAHEALHHKKLRLVACVPSSCSLQDMRAIAKRASTSNTLGRSVSAETVRRVLRKAGYNGRVARKKPLIGKRNRVKRLKFAKEHILKPQQFWNEVIFSDESKFNIFGSDGRRMVWRKHNTSHHPKHTIPTVKHGDGSVMVWGCMAAPGWES